MYPGHTGGHPWYGPMGVYPSQGPNGVYPSQGPGMYPGYDNGMYPSQVPNGVYPSHGPGMYPGYDNGMYPSQGPSDVYPSQGHNGVYLSQGPDMYHGETPYPPPQDCSQLKPHKFADNKLRGGIRFVYVNLPFVLNNIFKFRTSEHFSFLIRF